MVAHMKEFAWLCLLGWRLRWMTHHVHILEMNGESFRLKQSKNKS